MSWSATSTRTQRLEYPTERKALAKDGQGRIRLRRAIAAAYEPFMGKAIDPETEIVVTTGANEGMLSAFMGFVEPGDEVIVFEPYFDQ